MYLWVTAIERWPAKLAKILTPMPLLAKDVMKNFLPEWLLPPDMPTAL
jgi:hypothetical protein